MPCRVHAIEPIRNSSAPVSKGGGLLDFPQKKRFEGVKFNVISVTRDGCRVGVNFPGKKRYVTPE